jgi:hypothetical protein
LCIELRLPMGKKRDPDASRCRFVLPQPLIQLDQQSAQRFVWLTGEDDHRWPLACLSDKAMLLTALVSETDDGHVRR